MYLHDDMWNFLLFLILAAELYFVIVIAFVSSAWGHTMFQPHDSPQPADASAPACKALQKTTAQAVTSSLEAATHNTLEVSVLYNCRADLAVTAVMLRVWPRNEACACSERPHSHTIIQQLTIPVLLYLRVPSTSSAVPIMQAHSARDRLAVLAGQLSSFGRDIECQITAIYVT
jgi:hypothetical protein